MITLKEYPFGKIEIYDTYVLATINEGETVIPEYNKHLVDIANEFYKEKKFAYITNRVNSYAVDPRVYLETTKIDNLVAFAVITSEPMNMSNTEVEKIFIKKPFSHFKTIKEAITWTNSFILKNFAT